MRRASAAALAAFAACSAAFLLGQACSSFGADDGTTDATAADSTAGTDADATTGGDATTDGVADASGDGPALVGCAARYASGDAGVSNGGALIFCDDFEGTTYAPGWRNPFMLGGTPVIAKETGMTGDGALLLASDMSTGKVSLETPDLSSVALPFYLEFDFLPKKLPAFQSGYPDRGFVLVTSTNSGSVGQYLEYLYVGVSGSSTINPYLNSGDAPQYLGIGVWYHVVVGYLADRTALDIKPKATNVPEASRERALANQLKSLRLGLDTAGGPMSLAIDEFYIHH